jgi:6,7-dimethyl-8-ribityllumazine synthase
MPNIYQGKLSAEGLKIGIVVSRFNDFVSKRLLDGALDCLIRHNGNDHGIDVMYCPGSFEIPIVAQHLAKTGNYDAIIALGAVIRGDTPHFEYIATEVSKGISQVSLSTGVPISFGVITCDTMDQAIERAGMKSGNKGWDAALTAIEMVDLLKKVRGSKK